MLVLWPEEDVVLLQDVEDTVQGVIVFAEKRLFVQIAEDKRLVDSLPADVVEQLHVRLLPVRLGVGHPLGEQLEEVLLRQLPGVLIQQGHQVGVGPIQQRYPIVVIQVDEILVNKAKAVLQKVSDVVPVAINVEFLFLSTLKNCWLYATYF